MRPGYKRTEAGEIPEDWECRPLASLAHRVMVGIASAATHAYRSEGVVMFRNQNIRPGRLDDSDLLHIDADYEQVFRNKRLQAGDLITARTGYPGTTCVVPDAYAGAQSFTTLITRPNRGVARSDYLCYCINGPIGKRFFHESKIGGSQQNVNVAALRLLPVALPSTIAEQSRIAELIADGDALIESLEHLLAKKRAIKQGAMQSLLTGAKRLPGFGDPWTRSRLGAITGIAVGRTPPRSDSRCWGPGFPWLTIGDMQGKRVRSSKEQITSHGINGMHPVRRGTLMMSFKLSIGRLCFADCDLFTNEAICAFEQPEADPDFLYYSLTRTDFSLYGKQAVKGYTLNQDSLRSIEVDLPSRTEQAAIAEVLADLDADIDATAAKLDKARALKHGMMQELLTGRIRLV